MKDRDWTVAELSICRGQPVIRGTRVLVRTARGHSAHGAMPGEVLAEFPSLTEDDVRAVMGARPEERSC